MHRRVRGVVGPGMASVASMVQHELVGDQGTPVNSQHESMQRHRSDDMGLKDARASESDKADYSMKEAPCGASHSTPSGETIGTGTGKPELILRLRQHPRAKAALCLTPKGTVDTELMRDLSQVPQPVNGDPAVLLGRHSHDDAGSCVRQGASNAQL